MSKLIEILTQYIPKKDLKVTNVSEWSVGTQIEHCTKVIFGVCNSLLNSNPEDYKSKFNMNRKLIFTFGKIPRGVGKAPKSVIPTQNATEQELHEYLNKAADKLKSLEKLPPKSNFVHPYFGQLNLKEAKTFITIHTNHHISIIKDILKTNSKS